MDPQACLDRAWCAILIGDLDEARDALDDYYNWRRMGGFEPPSGDALARQIEGTHRVRSEELPS